MKTTKSVKISLLVLSLVLILGAVFAMSAGAESTGPEIISQNMAYSNEFKIMYAVDAASVPDGGAVTLKIYTKDPTVESSEPVATMTAEAATPAAETGNLNKDAYIFTTETGVSYAKMTLNFYAQAENEAGVKGAVKRYSVAEYFYEKLSDVTASDERKAFYQDTLDFGTGIQKFATTPAVSENELISNLRYVKVANGGTVGGYSAGIYLKGSTLTLDNPGTAKWNVVEYDINGTTVNFSSTTSEFVVADNTKTLVTTDTIADNRIYYRDEIDNFNKYVPGVDVPYIDGTSIAREYVTSNLGHDVVAKLTLSSTGSIIKFPEYGSKVSASDATAWEISFDMKFNTVENSNKEYLWFYFAYDNSWKNGFYFYRDENGSTYIINDDSVKTKGEYTIQLTTTEWFNVRLVRFAGDVNIYMYINGNDEPLIFSNGSAVPTMADFTNYKLWFKTVPGGTDVYIDNYYCGYVNDTTKPQ